MKGRWFPSMTAALLVAAAPQGVWAQTVQACPNPNNCVQVQVGGGAGSAGDTIPVTLSLRQAPNNNQAGGPDETAALALTLSIAPNGVGLPLRLADCARNSDGLPAAVIPDAAISNFKLVVENAYCDSGRTHCLCPETGAITPDNFINLVVYGPNPLPAPGSPVDIPVLPAGPQTLATINLRIQGGASGSIPLRVYTETRDSQKPQFTAFLSVGDRLAVDQTCVPVTGQPPCSAGSTSQVVISDGAIDVQGGCRCIGDCSGDGEVTIEELLVMVNIALEIQQVTACPCGDADSSGGIDVGEIIQAVNFALGLSTCS
jgi:hypothetical protein